MAGSKADKAENVKGKFGTYVIKGNVGHGGNGEVFAIDIQDRTNLAVNLNASDGYVLKKLKKMEGYKPDERVKREKRFQREIDVVCNKLQDLNGIIPILDSSFENPENDDPYQWYLMPQARKFEYTKYSVKEITYFFLQVAETIAVLHDRGMSHRDIKPNNLLIYNNRLCLTDFGLIWADDFDELMTGEKEDIGPCAIRPPELKAPIKPDGAMFQKSDVYLFAKTLWICLTRVKGGFYKEYSRSDDDIYLTSILNIEQTLEPIHLLMERTTCDDYMERITIDECVELLRKQMAIFNRILPQKELDDYIYDEKFHKSWQSSKPDEIVIKTPFEIAKQLTTMANGSKMIIVEAGRDYNIGAMQSVQLVDEYVYELTFGRISGALSSRRKKLFFRIKEIRIGKDRCFIANTERLGNPAISGMVTCGKLNSLFMISEDRIGIDGEYVLKFVP